MITFLTLLKFALEVNSALNFFSVVALPAAQFMKWKMSFSFLLVNFIKSKCWGFLGGSLVKNPPEMPEV